MISSVLQKASAGRHNKYTSGLYFINLLYQLLHTYHTYMYRGTLRVNDADG